MKVFMINTVCGIKSTGRICTDLADVLESKGHGCRIAYGREIVPPKYQKIAIQIGNKLSRKVDAVCTKLFDTAGFNSRWATKELIKQIEDYAPDIIHLHNLHGCYINIDVLFCFLKKFGKPVVWTLHDCWPFTGHCAYFSAAGCQKWEKGCRDCPQRKNYPTAWLLDRSKCNYRKKKKIFTQLDNLTIVTPSHWLAALVQQAFLNSYQVKVIHNGIDTKVFKPTMGDFRKEYGLEHKKIVLGVASSWDERKGFSDFITLARRIETDTQLVMVGLSQAQCEELPDNILGITRTDSPEELAELYSAADLFINLTYEDNYPTVNLEAQACGTPVITYNTGGSVESVPKTNVVAQGDLQGIIDKIKTADHPLVDIDFTKNTAYEAYIQLYEDLL